MLNRLLFAYYFDGLSHYHDTEYVDANFIPQLDSHYKFMYNTITAIVHKPQLDIEDSSAVRLSEMIRDNYGISFEQIDCLVLVHVN